MGDRDESERQPALELSSVSEYKNAWGIYATKSEYTIECVMR